MKISKCRKKVWIRQGLKLLIVNLEQRMVGGELFVACVACLWVV